MTITSIDVCFARQCSQLAKLGWEWRRESNVTCLGSFDVIIVKIAHNNNVGVCMEVGGNVPKFTDTLFVVLKLCYIMYMLCRSMSLMVIKRYVCSELLLLVQLVDCSLCAWLVVNSNPGGDWRD